MKAAFALLAFFIFSISSKGQPFTSTQIDSIVAKSMSMMPLAGISVAVVKDGKIIHAKGYGVTNVKTGEKVNENTLFAIASNTKAFTTMALAILVDEGKLKWTDPVQKFIPEFKMYDPYVSANFNIEDLLTHRSGLGLGAGDLMFFPDGSDFTIKDVLNSFQYQKPVSAFRTKYDYDNLLYIVAGEVVARVSGTPWADFVESRIMKPLGMTRTVGIYEHLKDSKNMAYPHSVKNGQLLVGVPYTTKDGTIGAAGGIMASVNDLSQWMLLHLNRGMYGEGLKKQMVSERNLWEMHRPHTFTGFTTNPNPQTRTHFAAYGLGWGIQDQNGYIMLTHTGGLPGMLSRTCLVPELNLGVVVLTNTLPGGYGYTTISRAIVNSYLGLRTDLITPAKKDLDASENRGDSVTTAVWNIVKKADASRLRLTDFTGTYRDNWFGDITITLKDGQLWFTSLRSPKLHGKMFYYKGNTFAIQWDYRDEECDAFATFALNEDGMADVIRMKGISPNIDFSFDFQDLELRRVK